MEKDILAALKDIGVALGIAAYYIGIVFLIAWLVVRPIWDRLLTYRTTENNNRATIRAKELEIEKTKADAEKQRTDTDERRSRNELQVSTALESITTVLGNIALAQTGQGEAIEVFKMTLPTKSDLDKLPAVIAKEIQDKIDAKLNALSDTLQAKLADVLNETHVTREEFKAILKQSLDAFLKEVISELKPLPPPDKPETIPTPLDEAIKPGA